MFLFPVVENLTSLYGTQVHIIGTEKSSKENLIVLVNLACFLANKNVKNVYHFFNNPEKFNYLKNIKKIILQLYFTIRDRLSAQKGNSSFKILIFKSMLTDKDKNTYLQKINVYINKIYWKLNVFKYCKENVFRHEFFNWFTERKNGYYVKFF